MFPLWDVAIAPVLQAARARRVVEIGALRGETTARMLHSLGPEAELHVIDPLPGFDPAEHEAMFAGRYCFHEALSLDVLGSLGAFDAALIDGDHNWYTVYNELRLLAGTARDAGALLPVLVMHDVLWPYGRRDLYYDPSTIPEAFRQPHRMAGMRPGQAHLCKTGGVNPTLHNAEVEGGPRNGVMTALEDFMAEHDRPLRRVVLPIYFGLAIVVEEDRLAAQPELAAALDHLEGSEGRLALLEVSEQVRLRAVTFQHTVHFERGDQLERSRARHLRVVKQALLNEHYLDHELRMNQLTGAILHGRALQPEQLRDPVRNDQIAHRDLVRQRSGPSGPDASAAASFLPYAAMGRPQLDHLEQCLDAICAESVPGDLVECGTGRGGGAIFLRAYLDAHEQAGRQVWVADRFRASEAPATAATIPKSGVGGFHPDLNLVRDGFARFELLDDRVRFLQGPVGEVLADAPIHQVALLRVGRTAGAEVGAVLTNLYDRVSDGGFVIVDLVDDPAALDAVEQFRRDRGSAGPLTRVGASAVTWRRSVDETPTSAPTATANLRRAPAPPPLPDRPVDLSVVVVFYNMRREAARTLHSLSRSYQEGIEDLDYEVLVVENGSADDERLGADLVASFGPEFRYLDLADQATPSPAVALNRGIRAGRGRAFALMIDGAHVLTPGVLRHGMAGLRTYEPALVATQQWYVGPGQQGDAMDRGYDTAFEDRLFERIRWPHSGYRLFEIGHFIGDRDWLDGVWESNCLFVPRPILEQVGGFDESFAMAGGGYANLELYERIGSTPDLRVATILGEGSFHQIHGGTTTNQADPAERRDRVFGYGQHFAELRGRAFHGPGKPIHYVGHLPIDAARRSKARRMSSRIFAESAGAGSVDGPPAAPVPVPDDLRWGFTEAVWHNLPWEHTSWMGRPISSAPTDLFAYQEIIDATRPDWIIETGTGDGGRAHFLASICELVGAGRVLSIDADQPDDLPRHPRLEHLTGIPHDPATVAQVLERVGPASTAIVVLGAPGPRDEVYRAFKAYADLVPVGSYLVVTDTVVNGHPVWPGFGAGPAEAVKQILKLHGEFVAEPALEKYSLSFNPGGFLRRAR